MNHESDVLEWDLLGFFCHFTGCCHCIAVKRVWAEGTAELEVLTVLIVKISFFMEYDVMYPGSCWLCLRGNAAASSLVYSGSALKMNAVSFSEAETVFSLKRFVAAPDYDS